MLDILQVLADVDGHKIVVKMDGCKYYIDPENKSHAVDSVYQALALAPESVRPRLSKEAFDDGISNELTCPSCNGAGVYDVGDCEDGVWNACEECSGFGTIPGE